MLPTTTLARHHWVRACAFEPGQESELLTKISGKIHDSKRLNMVPHVLLDLDSTLYEVAPRSHQILVEAARALKGELPAPVLSALETLEELHLGYSLEDTWSNLGLCMGDRALTQARHKIHSFWRQNFFTNDYLSLDKPYPGSRDFVLELHRLGANLVYLTGRDEPGMRTGTQANLERDGFPVGPGVRLCMKPSRDGDDALFKVAVARNLSQLGPIVASFENEPRNFAALAEAFPSAVHVFVDSICSDKPAPVVRGGYRLERPRA